MLQEDYTVRLESFQGPLDLLLYLIRRAEVDILDIPIASLTNQYLEFLEHLDDRIDIELAGEFLVMAATLMEIKSRMIMPPDPNARKGAAGGGEQSESAEPAGLDQSDPRYELVKQLLAYKAYRDAAERLDHRKREWEAREPLSAVAIPKAAIDAAEDAANAGPGAESDAIATDLEEIGVWDLFQTFQRIIEAVDFGRLGAHQVEYDDTPIQLHQEDLIDQLRSRKDRRLSLREACAGRRRGEMIGLFLATLELVRQRRVSVVQDRISDDICLELRDEAVEERGVSPIEEEKSSAAE